MALSRTRELRRGPRRRRASASRSPAASSAPRPARASAWTRAVAPSPAPDSATAASGAQTVFEARVRIDTPKERDYFLHGGILQYVLRQLAGSGQAA